ncbi:MAG: hypothetical protein WCK49_08950 [Myxococcaceae bacterium]
MRMSLLGVLLALSGCLGTVDGDSFPEDSLYYPSVLLQKDNTLYVVNSNLDLRYQTGGISQIDLTSRKVSLTKFIPSLAGQAVANDDFSILITTSQQRNSLLDALSGNNLSLQYNAPYFVGALKGQTSGLLGYLNLPINEFWDNTRFSLVADQPEIQAFTYDKAAGIQITKNYQIATCFDKPAKSYRRIARLGGISIQPDNTYILAEFFIDDPSDNTKFSKRVFLIRTNPKDTLCDDKTTILDITKTEKAQAARALVVADSNTAYALLDEYPILVKIDLKAQNVTERVPTCKGPATLKLSPDALTLLVACPKTNELIAYNASDLGLFGRYMAEKTKSGPVDVLFDQTTPNRIFVSYQQDHAIGILKYENSAPHNRSLGTFEWLQLPR